MVDLLKQAIEKEMQSYASELQVELQTKYVQEFNERLSKHRNKLVLDAVEQIRIESKKDGLTQKLNINLQL
jgi:hypothetical protein